MQADETLVPQIDSVPPGEDQDSAKSLASARSWRIVWSTGSRLRDLTDNCFLCVAFRPWAAFGRGAVLRVLGDRGTRDNPPISGFFRQDALPVWRGASDRGGKAGRLSNHIYENGEVRMVRNNTIFEYCLELDGRELWIEVTESGISHWYDRTGALEAIPGTRNLERRAFMEDLLVGGEGRTALRVARDRENFTVSVELSKAVLSQVRKAAGISAKSGMTAADEDELDRLLDPVFRNDVQEFLWLFPFNEV